MKSSCNVLVLYAANSIFTNTGKDYLDAFYMHSKNNVYYYNAIQGSKAPCSLENFDMVFLHYTVRLSLTDYISPWIASALIQYKGLKILSVQDEYENTETTRRWIERLGFQVVLTCVPEEFRGNIYPTDRFPGVKFYSVLTGYVPDYLKRYEEVPLIADRSILVGYRGRALHPVYGKLGREKQIIAEVVKDFATKRNLAIDIEWEDKFRIYGNKWIEFLSSCKAILGTESGANVFDFDGRLRDEINRYMQFNPTAEFSDIEDRFLSGLEGRYAKMNQISPRIFEAISVKTALILYEGSYSNIVLPDIHYLPLKKDHSNLIDVFSKLRDDSYIQKMVYQAYDDIIESDKYSYSSFISFIDGIVEEFLLRSGKQDRVFENNTSGLFRRPLNDEEIATQRASQSISTSKQRNYKSVLKSTGLSIWKVIPISIKRKISPIIKKILFIYTRSGL